jgi:hypothetical protein
MGNGKKLIPPQGGSATAPPMVLPRGRSSNHTGPTAETPPPKVYAITVTDGDSSVRYEAPTLEEVRRLAVAGVPAMQMVEKPADDAAAGLVTLTEAK